MAEDRRRQATIVGVALLGAAGLMLLHNSSRPAPKPSPSPTPTPTPTPVPQPGPSGGVPPAPKPVATVPAAVRKPVATAPAPKPVYTAYRLNSNGTTSRLLTTTVLNAAIAVCKPYGCAWVLDPKGRQVYRTACSSAPTRALPPPPPNPSIVARLGAKAPGFRF